MSTSQGGNGAYNQLLFDDSPGQPRMALQSHARPHTGTAELNLGTLRHQTDNQRLDPVGFSLIHIRSLQVGERCASSARGWQRSLQSAA